MARQYSTGWELVLNACEGVLQIAVTNDEQPVCFQEWFLPKHATEILVPALSEIFQRLGITAQHFRRIGCFAGPGSFTGIRLVLTTAQALRRTTRAKLAQLDYLQALATSAVIRRGFLYPGKIFVITHARRNLVHLQEFCSYGPQIPALPMREASLVAPAEALAALGQDKCLVCGSGLGRHPDVFAAPITGQGPVGAPDSILMPELTHPDFAALCLLARHGDYFPEDVQPKYVRGCDAVEHLQAEAGEDAEELVTMREILARKPESQI